MANLPKDPVMLMSLINMRLRDTGTTFHDFCASEGVDPVEISSRLAEAGFEYLPDINQFR